MNLGLIYAYHNPNHLGHLPSGVRIPRNVPYAIVQGIYRVFGITSDGTLLQEKNIPDGCIKIFDAKGDSFPRHNYRIAHRLF